MGFEGFMSARFWGAGFRVWELKVDHLWGLRVSGVHGFGVQGSGFGGGVEGFRSSRFCCGLQ